MKEAVDFCKKAGFKRIYLWTFARLYAARRLYEKWGFILTKEYSDDVWGNNVTHQMFELKLK